MASPQAAGAGALLVSAAKQAGASSQPAQLRQALISSARFLDPERFQAYEQGNGLIDVGAAWNLLQTNIEDGRDLIVCARSTRCSAASWRRPGVGVGIYDREGVAAGDRYTRTYTFTPHDGPGRAERPTTCQLGRQRRHVLVAGFDQRCRRASRSNSRRRSTPATAGEHSAILNLDDPDNARHRVPDDEHRGRGRDRSRAPNGYR